ncbi:MAG: hypothetical protein RLZZ271_468 [Pseudomonadota bacterium]|jgi:glycosyltransferase involved in cell wall biosynthesis
MRILACTHNLGMNGAALYLADALIHFKAMGAEVTVMCQGQHALTSRLQDHGIEFRAQTDSRHHDVALGNTIYAADSMNRLAPYLPVVFWIHEGLCVLNSPADMAPVQHALGVSSRVVFQVPWQTDIVYRSLLLNTQPHRVCHAQQGIDHFTPVGRPARDTQPHVLFAGGIFPNKRPMDLAAAVLSLTDMPMKCTMAGSLEWVGLNGPEFMQLVNSRPDLIRLEGEVTDHNDMQNLFAKANLFCLPSSDECFPRSILEAASAGLPLALSDIPCHKGIWEHGVNALLSPPGAVDMLHWNLRALASDTVLADRLSRAAHAVASRFSKQRFLNTMTRILEDAIRDPLNPARREPL